MEFWQTIAATVTGGAITLIATTITNNYQKKRDTNRKKLEKIEKAYELLTRIEHSYRMEWASDTASLNSGTYEKQFRNKELLPFDEFEMLIEFYVPQLKTEANELVAYSKEVYGKLSIKVIGVDGPDVIEKDTLKYALKETFDEIKNKISALKKKLVVLGNGYI